MSRMLRKLFVQVSLTLALVALLLCATTAFRPAHAATRLTSTTTQTTHLTKVSMRVTHWGTKARGVNPYNIVYGDCGSSEIEADNSGQTGRAEVYIALDSTLGDIQEVNYGSYINWKNTRTNLSGKEDVSIYLVNPTSFYDAYYIITTGTGKVNFSLTGSVTLVDGTVCSILDPTASATIS